MTAPRSPCGPRVRVAAEAHAARRETARRNALVYLTGGGVKETRDETAIASVGDR